MIGNRAPDSGRRRSDGASFGIVRPRIACVNAALVQLGAVTDPAIGRAPVAAFEKLELLDFPGESDVPPSVPIAQQFESGRRCCH